MSLEASNVILRNSWLSDEEAIVAQYRLYTDLGEQPDESTIWQGFSGMMRDVKVWFLVLNHLLITIAASFTK